MLWPLWVRHMLVWMVMVVVMVMVMEDGERWQNCLVHVLVWEVMLHHGEPDGVVEEVVVMELVVVVGPKRREWQGHEARGWWHWERTRRCIPRPTRHWPHQGAPLLCVLVLSEIILWTSE